MTGVSLFLRVLTMLGCFLAGTQAVFGQAGSSNEVGDKADIVEELRMMALEQIEKRKLRSLVLQVLVDGEELITLAEGEAMTGVPVTRDGHFRNGAVAITYVAAILLKLHEAGVVDLDEPIAHWLPDLPAASKATPRMLANMTAGYPDYVANQSFEDASIADPFRNWTAEERISVSTGMPRLFEPGTNWDYSHSGYVILGRVLEKASGRSMSALMEEYILKQLGLANTHSIQTAQMPFPAIHAFSGERGIYEDSTYWNPSWTVTEGAVQVTTIDDMTKSFDLIVGDARVLGASARAAMIEPSLVGFGTVLEGCRSCHKLTADFNYGLGVFLEGDWVFQTPLFGGYASSVATLPAERSPTGKRITIATAVTMRENAYSDWMRDFRTGPTN